MPLASSNALPKLGSKKLTAVRIDKFEGTNVLLSPTRLKKQEARESLNMQLIEDGIWDKRPGTRTLLEMGDDVDGFAEYVKSDGTRELIIASGGDIYKSTDLENTSVISGATYTANNDCFFLQINTYLYITNGVDAMIRYDGSTLAQYNALTAMGTVTPTRGAGLSAGSYNYYYKVTAVNAVGETAPSAEATISVNIERDLWDAANETIDLAWSAVTGALKYIIYFSDVTGFEEKLAEVTTNSFSDDGSQVPNPYIVPPTADSSSGPKLKYTWIANNRIWGTDPNNPFRIWFSGSGVNIGNFNTGFGGGWVEVEKGGRSTAVAGKEYQGKSHAIFQTPEGTGNLWQITLESQTISGSDVSFIVPVPTKVVGQAGSNAPRSVIIVNNDMWGVNKSAVQVWGNEAQYYNVIRSSQISAKIRPYMQSLSSDSISKVCAYYRESDTRVYISVPTSSGDPNRTIVYDREREAWYKDWSVGFTQFGEFTDTDGNTRFLGSDGVNIKEISDSYQDDDGEAFVWRYVSPQLPIADDWTQFAKIKKMYVRLRNTTGSINLSVSGTRKTRAYSQLGTATIEQGDSDTGIGWDPMGSVLMGETDGTPTVFAQESLIRFIKVNKLLRDIQWTIEGDSSVDRAAITGLMAKGFLVSAGDPSDWKL